ncbi:hypothetical protein C8R47DRAFT_526319 [Mycena vitilis]|nr:hypothetical protein C8R47DRAFT_526319 [Mycena vitilis]
MHTPLSPPDSQKAVASSSAGGDHRKRRRNRTTQSCLNCHATKRMCDRKRPSCTRCAQLCIGGNCLYEVNDTSRNAEQQSGDAILMNRIAELEAVVRKLRKNEPLTDQDGLSQAGIESLTNRAGWPSPAAAASSSCGSQYAARMSCLATTVPEYPLSNDPLTSLVAAYTLTDHMFDRGSGNCSCMSESACYTAVLELSMRLGNATDVFARSPSHSNYSGCALSSHIFNLDAFAKDSLDSSFPWSGRSFDSSLDPPVPPSLPTIFEQPYTKNMSFPWLKGDSDTFMTWLPTPSNGRY